MCLHAADRAANLPLGKHKTQGRKIQGRHIGTASWNMASRGRGHKLFTFTAVGDVDTAAYIAGTAKAYLLSPILSKEDMTALRRKLYPWWTGSTEEVKAIMSDRQRVRRVKPVLRRVRDILQVERGIHRERRKLRAVGPLTSARRARQQRGYLRQMLRRRRGSPAGSQRRQRAGFFVVGVRLRRRGDHTQSGRRKRAGLPVVGGGFGFGLPAFRFFAGDVVGGAGFWPGGGGGG